MVRRIMLALIIMIASVFIFSIAPVFAGAIIIEDSSIVAVDTVEVQPGEHGVLRVTLQNNNIDLMGLIVPLHFDSPYLTIDSISFENSFITSEYFGSSSIINDSNFMQINIIPDLGQIPVTPLYAPNGLIGSIHFTVSVNATADLIVIDSVNLEPTITNPVWRKVHFSDPDGLTTILPKFSEGAVRVVIPTGIDDLNLSLPEEYNLAQNYPNPFNPSTTIEFSLPEASNIKLQVYNILGQEVTTLAEGQYDAGSHQVSFDAAKQPSGVYFYRLTHKAGIETKKMILVK